MIFNIPGQTELVSTTVPYRVAVFDSNTNYEDNTEVRINDDTFLTRRVPSTYSDFNPSVDYAQGDRVTASGKVFEKLAESIKPIFVPGNAFPRTYDMEDIVEWDGESETATYTQNSGPVSPAMDLTWTFTLDDAQSTDNYRYFTATIVDNLDNTNNTTAVYKVYSSVYAAPIGGYTLFRGYLIKVNVVYDGSLNNARKWQELAQGLGTDYTIALDAYLPSVKKMPFDTKQYTSVVESGAQTWIVKSLKTFDGIALGRIRGDSVTAIFKDASGVEVHRETDLPINCTIDANLVQVATSEIIYAGSFIEANGTIEITINGAETEIGMIFSTASIVVGLTNLEFAHSVKVFDREEVSAISGYVDRITGNRIIYYTGSFDFEMITYDTLLLLTKLLTNELIGVDGSDMTDNLPADGKGTFASTKLICSVSQLKTASKVKDGDLEQTVPMTFEFKEIV